MTTTQQDLKAYQALFEKLDVENNGFLSAEELSQGFGLKMDSEELKNILDSINTTGDG